MERRAFLQVMGLSALAVGGFTACSTSSPAASPPSVPKIRIPLSQVPIGGGLILDEEEIVVTQATSGQYRAFSAICQHQRCTVGSIEGNAIVCPCHGSRYSIVDGSIVNGPTERPLPVKASSVEGSELLVTP